jgi:23S rRNA (guanine745-N1)-methyltransferase
VLDDVVGFLRCPLCHEQLTRAESALRCPAGHGFDVARQGYVSLLPSHGHPGTADTQAMVAARDQFLRADHYSGIAAAVAEAVARSGAPAGCVVDVGAGTGYYLAQLLDSAPDHVGLALDISKFAARRAAKAHGRIGSVVTDVWQPLPVRDATAAVALSIFAPRNGAELHRILQPGGCLVVVTPTREHLAEIVAPLGLLTVDERKPERLSEKLAPYFAEATAQVVEHPLMLDHEAVRTVVAMGPSAWHSKPEALAELIAGLADPITVTVSVTVATYRPHGN